MGTFATLIYASVGRKAIVRSANMQLGRRGLPMASREDVKPEDFWPIVMQDDQLGHSVRNVLSLLTLIPKKQLQGASVFAMQNIERASAIGPILDPTAWLGGTRFDNAMDTKDVLAALCKLRDLLPEEPAFVGTNQDGHDQ